MASLLDEAHVRSLAQLYVAAGGLLQALNQEQRHSDVISFSPGGGHSGAVPSGPEAPQDQEIMSYLCFHVLLLSSGPSLICF